MTGKCVYDSSVGPPPTPSEGGGFGGCVAQGIASHCASLRGSQRYGWMREGRKHKKSMAKVKSKKVDRRLNDFKDYGGGFDKASRTSAQPDNG